MAVQTWDYFTTKFQTAYRVKAVDMRDLIDTIEATFLSDADDEVPNLAGDVTGPIGNTALIARLQQAVTVGRLTFNAKGLLTNVSDPTPDNNTVAAANVTVEDTAGNFQGDRLEDVLIELFDAVDELSAAEIRDLLITLDGDDRLPASAIKDLSTGSTALTTSVLDNDNNFPEVTKNVEAVLAWISGRLQISITSQTNAGGMLRGSYPNPTLELVNSIDPGTYPRATLTVDEFGRVVGIVGNAAGDVGTGGSQRANEVPTNSPLIGPDVQAELVSIRNDIGGSTVPVRVALDNQSGGFAPVPNLNESPRWLTVSRNGIELFDGYSIPAGGGQVNFTTALNSDKIIVNYVN